MNRVSVAAAAAALGLMVAPASAQTNPGVETVVVTGAKLPEDDWRRVLVRELTVRAEARLKDRG